MTLVVDEVSEGVIEARVLHCLEKVGCLLLLLSNLLLETRDGGHNTVEIVKSDELAGFLYKGIKSGAEVIGVEDHVLKLPLGELSRRGRTRGGEFPAVKSRGESHGEDLLEWVIVAKVL